MIQPNSYKLNYYDRLSESVTNSNDDQSEDEKKQKKYLNYLQLQEYTDNIITPHYYANEENKRIIDFSR